MKICFLAAADSIHSYKWIKFFFDKKYEIVWISNTPSIFEIPPKLTFYQLNENDSKVKKIFKARRIISEQKPDILHIHYLGIYALIAVLSKVENIVSTPWGSDIIENKKSFLKKFIFKKILRKTKLLTCDAYHMKDEILDFGFPVDKIHIINFGIDTKRFSKIQKPNSEIRNKFKFENEFVILSLRNFEPVYDVENLINAANILVKKFRNVRFLLFGKGTLKEDLVEKVEKLNLTKYILFPGFLNNDQLPDALSAFNAYVSTSLSDAGISASTAEAMACELPVVVTDTGENNLWIEDGINGFLVPESEPLVLASKLEKLIVDSNLNSIIGKKGRSTIVERNDDFVEMEKMNDLYKSLIK